MTSTWHYKVSRIDSWQRGGLAVSARTGKARTFRPAGDAEAKRAHALHALAARPRGWPLDACYTVTVIYRRDGGHARDADRVLNLVLDALTGVAWKSDSDARVLAVHCERVRGDDGASEVRALLGIELGDGETLVNVWLVGGPPKRRRAK